MLLKFKFSEIIFLSLGSIAALFFFSEIYTSLYWTIGLILFFFGLILIKKPKPPFKKNFDRIFILFISLFFYFFFNNSIEIIFSFSNYNLSSITPSAYIYNYLYGIVLIFFSFMVGRNYSYCTISPLKIFSKVMFIQILVFIYYILPKTFSQDQQASLGFGLMIVATLPYLLTAFKFEKSKYDIFFILLLMLYLLLISNRGSFLSISVFLLTYILYPTIIKSPKFFKFYLIVNFLTIILLIYLYLNYSSFGNELSLKYFNKDLDSGRPVIWLQLLEYINEELLFGYGTDQSSTYIQSFHSSKVSLSSHNSYLEILLTGGLLGLSLLLLLTYFIWLKLYSKKENYWGKIGSCLIISVIYGAATGTNFISGNMMFNFMIWFF